MESGIGVHPMSNPRENSGGVSIRIGGNFSGQLAVGNAIKQVKGRSGGRPLRKIKVLFLAANPDTARPLSLAEEVRRIEDEIRASACRDALELISKWAVQPEDLQRVLLAHQPQILHFSGHGNRDGELLFERGSEHIARGTTRDLVGDASSEGVVPGPVGKVALTRLIRAIEGELRVILLNACFSESQAKHLAECVDCAIGMSTAIGDRAAIVFAGAFYRAIGYGRSVQAAFELGVNAIQLLGIPEDATPRLFTRDGLDASKIVLIPS
jgi:CHAT domain